MIGDWVLKDMNYSEEDPLYTKLDYRPYQIMSGEDIDLACETNCIGDADVYQPIPLTPEILEMNGFTENYRYDDLSYIQSCGAVTGIHINGKNGCMEEMYFKYVQEVQHALRICGLNELADNFKLEG